MVFFNWKDGYMKRRRDREEDLLSDDSFPKLPQWLELSHLKPGARSSSGSPIWVLVPILAAPLPIQLPDMAWEGSRRQLKALGLCTHVGDLEEVPSSWLQIGTAPVVVLTWGVNHQTKDLPLCLSSFLYI